MQTKERLLGLIAVVLMGRAVVNVECIARAEVRRTDQTMAGDKLIDRSQDFDIISIKPNDTGGAVVGLEADLVSLTAKNIALKLLIANAYGVRVGRVIGLPGWAEKARWDIRAKISESNPKASIKALPPAKVLEVYRSNVLFILRSRFGFRAHMEQRSANIYRLEVAKGGPKVKVTQTVLDQQSLMDSKSQITGKGVTMEQFAKSLSSQTGETIVDETNLSGQYDLKLVWTPLQGMTAPKDIDDSNKPPPLDVAIEDQLGLRLVEGRGAVDTLIVDTIDRPLPD